MIRTALWISSYYMCTLIDALRLFYIDKKAVKTKITYTVNWKKIEKEPVEDIEGLVDRSVDSLDDQSAALLFGDRLMEYVKQNFLIKKETLAAAHKIPLENGLCQTGSSRIKKREGAESRQNFLNF